MSDPAAAAVPVSAPNPKLSGGCIMLMVVLGWFLALGIWMVWHLRGQVREMRQFTETSAQKIGPEMATGAEMAALRERLHVFGDAVLAKQAAVMELSVMDLNHLLASQEPLNRLQDLAKVEEITDVIRVKVALALNGMPFSGERLYLNGYIGVRPEVKSDRGLVLLTKGLEVPGKTPTEGFVQKYLEANHLDGLALDELRKDQGVNAILTKVTAVRCEGGKVIAEYAP